MPKRATKHASDDEDEGLATLKESVSGPPIFEHKNIAEGERLRLLNPDKPQDLEEFGLERFAMSRTQ